MNPKTARQLAKESGQTYYRVSHACKVHGGYLRYTSNGTCPDCQREHKAKSRVRTGETTYPSAYYSGRNYRTKGRKKIAPATLVGADVYWWLAGWNDRDIELIE